VYKLSHNKKCIHSIFFNFIDFLPIIFYTYDGVGGILMAGNDPNYVSENPFEGRGRASQRNDIFDAAAGFIWSFGFFTVMFVIAAIVEVASR
jgi:hypothetical protein